jgi:hypothetical protein
MIETSSRPVGRLRKARLSIAKHFISDPVWTLPNLGQDLCIRNLPQTTLLSTPTASTKTSHRRTFSKNTITCTKRSFLACRMSGLFFAFHVGCNLTTLLPTHQGTLSLNSPHPTGSGSTTLQTSFRGTRLCWTASLAGFWMARMNPHG